MERLKIYCVSYTYDGSRQYLFYKTKKQAEEQAKAKATKKSTKKTSK